MSSKRARLGQAGIAHLGLIILLILIVGVGAVAYKRVQSANSVESATSSSKNATDEEKLQTEMDNNGASVEQSANVSRTKEADL